MLKTTRTLPVTSAGKAKDGLVVRRLEVDVCPCQDIIWISEPLRNDILGGIVGREKQVVEAGCNIFQSCLTIQVTDSHCTIVVDLEQRCVTARICDGNGIVRVEDQEDRFRRRSLRVVFSSSHRDVLELSVEANHVASLRQAGGNRGSLLQSRSDGGLRGNNRLFN